MLPPVIHQKKLEGYRVDAQIGSGGMAIVYRARQHSLGRDVALKVMQIGTDMDGDQLERFRREYRTLATLAHPHVMTVYDCGLLDGRPYFTMELLAAPTLGALMEATGYPDHQLPLRTVLDIVIDLLAGLAHCHAAGVVHRDIKPPNVFVHPDRGAILADFGIAKTMDSVGLTRPGHAMGTVAYMSPEQAAGQPITPASDLYAVGLLLFELIAGRMPFQTKSPSAMMMAHKERTPPRLAQVAPGTPAEIDRLVDRALAKDPDARPADAREFSACLAEARARLTAAAVSAPAVPSRPASSRPVRVSAPEKRSVAPRRTRGPLLASGLALGLAILAAGIWLLPGQVRDVKPQVLAMRPGLSRASVVPERLVVARRVDAAELSFSTALPVRVFASFQPAPGSGNQGLRQSKPADGPHATQHRVVLDQLDPDSDYVASLTFLTEDMASSRSGQITIPGATRILNEVVERIGRFNGSRVISAMQSLLLRRKGPRGDRAAAVRRALAPHFSELSAIAGLFRPLAAHFFTSKKVFVREKARVYELLALAEHVDRFCGQEEVDLSTGLSDIDRGPFRRTTKDELAEADPLPFTIPDPRTFMTMDGSIADPVMFGKRTEVEVPIEVRAAGTVRRAELALRTIGLPPQLYFEVQINNSMRLTIPGRAGAPAVWRNSWHYHQFDPSLLVEGTNRFSITLRAIPGLMCPDTPVIEESSLRLVRSAP